jgi:ribosomal protein L11 methyltransferase
MKPKLLWKISVTTTPEAEDAVAELMNATLNRPATVYLDVESGLSTVTVYLQRKTRFPRKTRADISTGLRRISGCGLKISPGKIVLARVRRENWAESWKRHFQPIEIIPGRRHSIRAASMARRGLPALPKSLLIKPSWSKRKARKGQTVLVLDPGLSFGTGHHPTTAFCLSELVQFQSGRDSGSSPSFLDLGAGSGILAIAAVKLGYSPVVAMDFDPEAIRVACANARANHVEQKLEIRRGDVTHLPVRPRRQFDLACANLISTLLIAERRRIAAQLDPAGRLVLAGILKSEFRQVQKAYKTLGLKLVSYRDGKEWRSGSFRFDG